MVAGDVRDSPISIAMYGACEAWLWLIALSTAGRRQGRPHDAVNEPFSIARVSDHAHELVDVLLGAVSGLKDRIGSFGDVPQPRAISRYALVAWLTSVSNGARAVAWLWLIAAFDLRYGHASGRARRRQGQARPQHRP